MWRESLGNLRLLDAIFWSPDELTLGVENEALDVFVPN
jgi:hypothetical protein